LEGRTRAFGRTGKRVYLECTVSIEEGRIWREITNGTDSRILRPCPHCSAYVVPEREHLVGWMDARSEEEAAKAAFWSCPECGEAWTEDERSKAAEKAVLVHRGQSVTADGEVVGEPPLTQTLGFRWSAIDNPFVTAADLGAEEWLARRSRDREGMEKKMRQFVWALPYESPDIDLTQLTADDVQNRVGVLKRGVVPEDCIGVSIGIDTGLRALHWEAKAIRPDGSKAVIEYGRQMVEADRLGAFRGLLEAFRKLRDYLEGGWNSADGKHFKPSQVWIDSGYHKHTDAVYALCAEANEGAEPGKEIWRPAKGYGEGQFRAGFYLPPKSRSPDILFIGRGYHIAKVRRGGKLLPGVMLVHVNSDYWKSEFHQGLAKPADEAGAITLFESAEPMEHSEYSAHATAEREIEKFLPSRGLVVVWERIDRNNHWFDAGYLATAAGEFILAMREKRNGDSEAKPLTLSQLAQAARRR
jgi:phage terminase large subunit GpA-like protein